MKKGTSIIGILFSILFLSGKEIQEEAIAVNIEVPVRVFKGNTFVGNLSIDDFEVYEEGVLQEIEAVYLINKTSIAKKSEEKKKFSPETSRNFYLFFEITEYTPKVGDAIDYFIQNVILPTDNLVVITQKYPKKRCLDWKFRI